MSQKPFYLLITILFLLSLSLASCGPAAAQEPVEDEAPAEEAPAVVEEEAPMEEEAAEEIPCDFDEQTCEFLKDQDFTGQTLVVGVWGGTIEEILREIVIPPLEARGARVELLLGGAGDRLAKIYAEQDNPTMDIAYLNIHTGPQATKDGVTEPPTDEVPAYADLYDFAKTGCYGMSLTGVGIMYNTDFFSSPPEWEDLWTQAKGKVSLSPYPATGNDALIAVAGRLAGGDEHDIDLALDKLAELKPIPLVAMGGSDELNLYLNDGDVAAALNLSAYSYSAVDAFENIGFSWPTDPGAMLAMDTLCIVKGTEVHDLALAWTQIALSPKTQSAYAERIYFGPTNSTVEVSPEIADRVIDGKEEVDRLLQPDYTYLAEIRNDLVERWEKELVQDD
jgi:putative spermidine/putrescine transport system substrate-binding protein